VIERGLTIAKAWSLIPVAAGFHEHELLTQILYHTKQAPVLGGA